MKDILMPDEIRKAIEHPVLGNNHFGSWGILNIILGGTDVK